MTPEEQAEELNEIEESYTQVDLEPDVVQLNKPKVRKKQRQQDISQYRPMLDA